jgi:hypothetical protein
VAQRSEALVNLMALNYIAKLSYMLLARLGFNWTAALPSLISRISYTIFLAQCADMFKTQFLTTFFPLLEERKRQLYMVNKSGRCPNYIKDVFLSIFPGPNLDF